MFRSPEVPLVQSFLMSVHDGAAAYAACGATAVSIVTNSAATSTAGMDERRTRIDGPRVMTEAQRSVDIRDRSSPRLRTGPGNTPENQRREMASPSGPPERAGVGPGSATTMLPVVDSRGRRPAVGVRPRVDGGALAGARAGPGTHQRPGLCSCCTRWPVAWRKSAWRDRSADGDECPRPGRAGLPASP